MTTNDNTLKTIGFIYQAYIGLIKCLELRPGERVIMEHLGDVTKISISSVSQQIEVKHHFEDATLTDRSLEIWNTVWNWYNNSKQYSGNYEFILFTTSKLSQKSMFSHWATMNAEQRYLAFKRIGEIFKKNEQQFRQTYNKIFSPKHDPEKLKSILSRFKILSEQQTIKTIIDQYYETTFRFLEDKQRMEEFVSSMVGHLLTIPIKHQKWEVTYDVFNNLFGEYAKRFVGSSETPMQLQFEFYEPTPSEHQSLIKKHFVSEIQRIDLTDEVTDAINDYCRASKTIISFFETNIVKSKDLKDYRSQLHKTLVTHKKLSIINCKNDLTKILTESQKLYFGSMSLEARQINGISNNRDFFQRGVIHGMVDDKELTWHIGDN
ncbi:ABC-three component system protein [Gorillibacterium sp. CAU 1737]|uniref:ABC-three component system protein n=1 Tax=Gorillibacterium sp. CAU 1737 TaxID=3140362 RepID=UPI0032605CB4